MTVGVRFGLQTVHSTAHAFAEPAQQLHRHRQTAHCNRALNSRNEGGGRAAQPRVQARLPIRRIAREISFHPIVVQCDEAVLPLIDIESTGLVE